MFPGTPPALGPALGPPPSGVCADIICADNFEGVAGKLSKDNAELTADDFVVATPQDYDSKTNQSYVRPLCFDRSYKFWLSDVEDADSSQNIWGSYGITLPTILDPFGCDVPNSENDNDWYPDNDPNREIVKMGLYRALWETWNSLKYHSEHLPPLVEVLDFPSAVDFSSSPSLVLHFEVQENRTPDVRIAIKDKATGKYIKAYIDTHQQVAINGTQDTGTKYPLGNPDMQGNHYKLPYHQEFTLTWDGKLSDGSTVGTGTQSLEFQVFDTETDHNGGPNNASVVVSQTITVLGGLPSPSIPPSPVSPGVSADPGPSVNTTTPVMTWTGAPGADGYGVYVSRYPYGTSNLAYSNDFIPGSSSSFTVPAGKLINGERYRWNMRAHNSAGWGAVSGYLYFQINPLPPNSLTIALSASGTSVTVGQTVSLTATFSGATSGLAPTGLAYFYDNFNGIATQIGTGTLSAGSSAGQYVASYSTNSLEAGQHGFLVIFNGDSNYGSAISNVVTVTVQQQQQGALALAGLTITPSTIVGGVATQGNITLTGNAPPGGAVVSLQSVDTRWAQVPPTVTVTAGFSTRAFPITTSFTPVTVTPPIIASYNNTTYAASPGLTVLPVAVSGVLFFPSTVAAGNPAPFTVYLTGPAPAGASVSLTSSDPSVLQVPSTAPLATGATSVSVTGTTLAVGSQTIVNVVASYNNSSAQGSLTVVPAPPLTVNTFSFSPDTITGGTSASGTVTLTGLAPPGGVNVTLSSSSNLVQPPLTVFVPAGAWYAPVSVPTSSVSFITNVTVTARYNGSSQSAPLWLVPPLPFLASLSLSPSTVNSGSSSIGTVSLTAPAPLGGSSVPLTKNVSNAVANVPQNAYVEAGATSATFTITTSPIRFIAPVTITASYNGTSQNVLLTIVPPGTPLAPSLLTLSPLSVTGGSTSTGTVSVTGPAPSGGAVLALSSDNSVVQVPPTISVPAGFSSAVFTASTATVSVISTATITATYNGISQSSLLTVKPAGSPPSANPVPFLASPLVPVSHTPGGTGFSVTVRGSGFVPGAQILWNGTALTTTFLTSSQMQASLAPATVQRNGSAALTVRNPGSVSPSSNPLPEHLTYPTSAPSFSNSSLSASGSSFVAVATGDFNRDSKLDLAVPNSSGLSIFMGNGDGTFGPETILPANDSHSVFVGDFNGDGKLDIVFNKSSTTGVIGVLLGNGDGTFTAMPDVPLPSYPDVKPSLAVGDFNGDGSLDLVVTGSLLTQAYVLLGKGDGTFGPPASVGSVNQPSSVAVGDFNGDGKLDIALPDIINQAVAILLGIGNGTFNPQTEYPANGYPEALSVADFNGDGRPDIAAAENGPCCGSSAAVLLNNGTGTFLPPVNYGAGQFYFIATDDLNGDGKLDLVVSSAQPIQAILAFLGNGNGTFSSTPITLAAVYSASLAVADLNGDGAPDILAPNNSSPILLQSISPILQVVPPSFSFTTTQGGAVPSPLILTISNTGGSTATWSATPSQPWVVLSQTSGTAPSAVTVTVNPSGLNPGTYNATIPVTATGASNSPQTVAVTQIVNPFPVVPTSLTFSPTALNGSGSATGTITLSGSAPVGGAAVSLLSGNAAVQVPFTVTIPTGVVSGTITATASAVTTQTIVPVTAIYNGVSTTAPLTLNPGTDNQPRQRRGQLTSE